MREGTESHEESPLMLAAMPRFAQEIERLLREQGRRDIATQLSSLRIYDRCRCGSVCCATFYTQPGVWTGGSRVLLRCDRGCIYVDLGRDGGVRGFDVAERLDVRKELAEVLPNEAVSESLAWLPMHASVDAISDLLRRWIREVSRDSELSGVVEVPDVSLLASVQAKLVDPVAAKGEPVCRVEWQENFVSHTLPVDGSWGGWVAEFQIAEEIDGRFHLILTGIDDLTHEDQL